MTGRSAIGVDIGGTKVAIGRLHSTGRLERLAEFPARRAQGSAELAAIRNAIAEHLTEVDAAVGVGVALPLRPDGVAIDVDGFFGWHDLPLVAEFSKLPRRIAVLPDARAAAIAERTLAEHGRTSMLHVSLGTGIATAFVRADGTVDGGARNLAGYSGFGATHRCRWRGCRATLVEQTSSGPAIAAAYHRAHTSDARPWASALRHGDPRAHAILVHAAWHLGAMLADAVLALDPAAVVIGGGFGNAVPELVAAVRGVIDKRLRDVGFAPVPVERDRVGPDAAWAGAAIAAFQSTSAPLPITKEAP